MQPRARTSQVGLRGFDVVDTGDGVRCTDLALSGVASRRDPGVTGRRSVRILDWAPSRGFAFGSNGYFFAPGLVPV